MNVEFEFNAEYLEECFKRRKKPEERMYPKKDWPVGYEPTKKEFEEWMEEGTGIPVSYHEEDIGGGRKRGVFTPIKKNIKILDNFEKALGNGQPVNFQIEDPNGELKKVSKEEFAEWMTEGKEEKNVNNPPKESLVFGASGDIDGITVFTERKGKDGFIRESYYQPRSEEEKKQIIERNKRRREEEKLQNETSITTGQNKEKEGIDLNELAKEANQQNNTPNESSLNSDDKTDNTKTKKQKK